jgi:hypothetical protein
MRALPLSTGQHDDPEDRYNRCSRRLPDRVLAQAVRDRVGQDARRVVKLSLPLRSALLAAILVSGSVDVASAECAWVLWKTLHIMNGGEIVVTEWSVAESYSTQKECEGWANQYGPLARAGKPASPVISFRCLPDTVDPRGPKGK